MIKGIKIFKWTSLLLLYVPFLIFLILMKPNTGIPRRYRLLEGLVYIWLYRGDLEYI